MFPRISRVSCHSLTLYIGIMDYMVIVHVVKCKITDSDLTNI